MIKRTLLPLTALLLTGSTCLAQLHFERYDSVAVSQENGTLRFPWAGGLNFPQFSNIDFNLDGRNDLFVFDKSGDKTVCFTMDENNELRLAPEYRAMFVNQHSIYKKRLHDWVLLRDFDADGDADIFTYSNGGLAVYRNDGNADTLIFTLMTPKLLSDYGNGFINIYVSPTDLPAIMDVDGDSDMDLITFSLFGTSAEYHRNRSMELYGIPDSLIFELGNPCWGDFEEDPSILGVHLNISCKGGNDAYQQQPADIEAHSGFTILGLDIEGDGDQDIVLSNVSYDQMNLLTNVGTASDAHIGSQDEAFPAHSDNTDSINIYTFPAAFLADVDNNGSKDLIASSYQENNGLDFNGCYLYLNTSTTADMSFEFVQRDFLQEDMIDLGTGAYPVFFDYDQDGLQDLLVGDKGYFVSTGNYSSQLAYYRNTGTAQQPAFTLVNRDLLDLSQLHLGNIAPTFGDIDGDGDDDMIVGDVDGLVHYFENSAGAGNPCSFALTSPGFQGINVSGQFATPCLFDVDGDSLLDLVIGERNGNLNYYRNSGSSTSPQFSLTDPDFGGVNMRDMGLSYGYSAPFLFRYGDTLRMLVGSESGRIDLYDNITGILSGPAQLVGQIGSGTGISSGSETTPFGFSHTSGRNQYLIKASELADAGLARGVITDLSLTTANGPSIPHAQFYIKMGLTDLQELNGFDEDAETVYFIPSGTVPQGIVSYTAQTALNWDGESNIVIEFCWFQTAGAGTDLNVEFSTTSFMSNAYSSSGNYSGCGIAYQGSNNERPNFTLTVKPSFHKKGEFPAYEGERIALFGSDLNSDSLLDLVMGNVAGGLAYYKGSEHGLMIDRIKEPERLQRTDMHVFPNPGSGDFTVEPYAPMEGRVDLTVYDMLGEMVWNIQDNDLISRSIDLTGLNSGLYVLVARSKNKVAFSRLIIQK